MLFGRRKGLRFPNGIPRSPSLQTHSLTTTGSQVELRLGFLPAKLTVYSPSGDRLASLTITDIDLTGEDGLA